MDGVDRGCGDSDLLYGFAEWSGKDQQAHDDRSFGIDRNSGSQ